MCVCVCLCKHFNLYPFSLTPTIYIYIYIYVVTSISFQTFLCRHLQLSLTLENSPCYCYTSYEMIDHFLSFQVQMNSYSRNSNTP